MNQAILNCVLETLRQKIARALQSAKDTHSSATDPNSKAEGKYDTRSLEESYLAAGQAQLVKDLTADLSAFEKIKVEANLKTKHVHHGSLVDLEHPTSGEMSYYLLAPRAGGLEIDFEGNEVTLLSSASPLYQSLLDKQVGDATEQSPFFIIRKIS